MVCVSSHAFVTSGIGPKAVLSIIFFGLDRI